MTDKTPSHKDSSSPPIDPLMAWHCRRGVLELDALLIPFFEKEGKHLTPENLSVLSDVLKESDHILTAWLLHKDLPNVDAKRLALIKKIRDYPTEKDPSSGA